MPYVNRSGVNIYYETYGQGEPLVWLSDISRENVDFYTTYRAYCILFCLNIVVLHGKYQRTSCLPSSLLHQWLYLVLPDFLFCPHQPVRGDR